MGIIVVLRVGLSILSGAQHDEGAGFYGEDAMVFCKLLQLRVFGAGIKDDPAGVEGEDIVVIFLLGPGIEVERYRIHGRKILFLRVYVYVGYPDLFFTDGHYGIALATQAVHCQVAVTLGIVGGAQHQCLFFFGHVLNKGLGVPYWD